MSDTVNGPGAFSRNDPADPTDLADPDNWRGGYYEMAIHLGPADDDRAERAVRCLWEQAGCGPTLSGSTPSGSTPNHTDHGGMTVADLVDAGGLRTAVEVPGSGRCVVAVSLIREEDQDGRIGDDWLDLSIPLGALERTNATVGCYPFGDVSASRHWREPIEHWFFWLARAVHAVVPIEYAVTGFEVSGDDGDPQRSAGRTGIVRAGNAGALEEFPVTEWV